MKTKVNIVGVYILISLQALIYFPASAQTKEEINGVIRSGQYEVARKMANQLIKKNDPLGFRTLGWLEDQQNTPSGNTASFRAYLKGAELGDIDSIYYVGMKYKKGTGTDRDINKAVFWLEKAANLSDVEAKFELADILAGGYDYPYDLQKASEIYAEIHGTESLRNTEIWVLSGFRLGWMFKHNTVEKFRNFYDALFTTVLQSSLKEPKVLRAQSMIKELVAKGESKAGQGDGTADDVLCQKYGFMVYTQPYSECRMKIDIARNEAKQRQALYEAEMARYNAQVAEYEKKKKREESDRLVRFGLALMGGTSPNFSENLNNANRAAAGLPPVAPQIQNFNIITPRGGVTPCTIVSNNVFCN